MLPEHRLTLTEVGKLLGVDHHEVDELIELAYLPEPSHGSVSLRAFLALLGRSVSNPRLQRLRIAEPVVWTWVFAGNPELLKTVVRYGFSAGTLGEVIRGKLLHDDDGMAEL